MAMLVALEGTFDLNVGKFSMGKAILMDEHPFFRKRAPFPHKTDLSPLFVR
jgi:hypothetical protein